MYIFVLENQCKKVHVQMFILSGNYINGCTNVTSILFVMIDYYMIRKEIER